MHVSSPIQKNMVKETRSNVWNYFSYNEEENSSRCLVRGQKKCGKILKGKIATNLKKHNKHKKEFEECDTTEKARGAKSTRTGRKRQAPSSQRNNRIPSIHHATTIKNLPGIQLLLKNYPFSLEPPMCPSP